MRLFSCTKLKKLQTSEFLTRGLMSSLIQFKSTFKTSLTTISLIYLQDRKTIKTFHLLLSETFLFFETFFFYKGCCFFIVSLCFQNVIKFTSFHSWFHQFLHQFKAKLNGLLRCHHREPYFWSFLNTTNQKFKFYVWF